jgi:tetratricopeptide (TPR) repeat protein
MGQYDQAYKHLRAALEQEQPKSPITAGYLALCGALGKPTNLDDKPKNINWSLRLLASFPLPTSAEWTGLACDVHAEARRFDVPVPLEDQRLLCDSLASLYASNVKAAAAFSHLAATYPEAVQPEYAFLYARAATAHGVTSPQDLDLFARTFQDPAAARRYYEGQKWELGEVEYTYLERTAKNAPGQFPEVLGRDYPRRGEAFLLERSVQLEQAGQKGPARASAEVLLRLAPASVAAHDRLACLHYRTGELDRAVELLGGWHRLAPSDHWPLVRQAIIEQERGNAPRRAEIIDHALGLIRGPLRAAVAFLGARLAIKQVAKGWSDPKASPARADEPAHESLHAASRLLGECLGDEPDHTEALWCLAAIGSLLGDREALAAQAPRMDRPEVGDGRFHYFGAVCHLAAQDYHRAAALGARAAEDAAVGAEGRFVVGWAQLRLGDLEGAARALQGVATDERSPSAVYARALLGQVSLARGAYDDAVRWWSAVDAPVREKWGLAEPLRQSVLLSGLLALQQGRYEPAAERLREAAKFGLRDRRLPGLITLALVKAGQKLLYEGVRGQGPWVRDEAIRSAGKRET